MATHLPTEILQSILLSLDLESFYSARLTCSSWHHAASDSFILRSVLAEAPVSLPETLDTLPRPQDWNTYFTQFAQRSLLDRRIGIEKHASKPIFPAESTSPTTPVALSPDGTKIAALKGARIILHDFHRDTDTSTFSRSRSLYPAWAHACRALVYGGGGAGAGSGALTLSQRYAKSRIALSTHGDLIAIAMGRTIQIYDLSEQALTQPPAEFILGNKTTEFVSSLPLPQTYQETDGVVESIAFAGDEDLLLRVVIGRESGASSRPRVRYLGDPAQACPSSVDAESKTQNDRLAYWRANLHRIYLDSTVLAASLTQPQPQPQPANTEPISVTGLIILRNSVASNLSLPLLPSAPSSHNPPHPYTYTYFLCTLHQSPKTTYCLARTRTPTSQPQPQPPPPPTILSTFLTRPSNPPHSPDPTPDSKLTPITPESAFTQHILTLAQHRWDVTNLPSATPPPSLPAATATPILAVSDDGALFVLYEPGAGHSYRGSGTGGAVYVYSLAGTNKNLESEAENAVPAWSFLLDIVDVDVEGIWVEKEKKGNGEWGVGQRGVYRITAVAGGRMLEWRLK